MTEDERVWNAIGIAMKAGKCVSGDFAVERTLRAGKVRLLLLDETVSQSTRERYEGLCRRFALQPIFVKTLGEAIGKPSRMIAAVTDENLTKMILGACAAGSERGK